MRKLVINTKLYSGNQNYNKYLSDISKINLDENEIIEKILNGDNSARELLVKANLRFVVSVAKQYLNLGNDLPTLISDGNLGLIIASQKFDPTCGFKFISYAVWWIRQTILQNLQTNSTLIRLPGNKQLQLGQLKRKIEQDEQLLNTDITYSVALDLYNDDKILLDLLYTSYGKKELSLDQGLDSNNDDSFSLLNVLENSEDKPEDYIEKQEIKEILKKIINRLGGYEKIIIEKIFGLNNNELTETVSSIANHFNQTEYWVLKHYKEALKKIKKEWNEYYKVKNYNMKPINTKKSIVKPINTKKIEPITIKPIIAKPIITKIIRPVIVKPDINYINVNEQIKQKNKIVSELTKDELNILDHLYGAFTGVKSTIGEVARKLNISKLVVTAAINKYNKISNS